MKFRGVVYLLLMLLAFSSGCQSASKNKPIVEINLPIPKVWSTEQTRQGEIDQQWWLSFNDPLLIELIQEALAHNHDLKAAVARMDIAAARVRLAGGDLYPQISGLLDGGKQQQNFVGFPFGGGKSTFTTYSLGATMNWELDLWGRIRAAREASFSDFQASKAELEFAHLSIAAQTAKAFFAVIEARKQIQLSQETVQTYRNTEKQVKDRVDTGVSPQLDLKLAVTNRSSAQALLEQRKLNYEKVIRQLELLLGRYPQGRIDTTLQLPKIPKPIPTGLPSGLLSRRLDIMAAEQKFQGTQLRVDEARAALYPSISLTTSGGTLSGDFKDVMSRAFSVWAISGNLTQPIFEGGKRLANIDIAKGQEKESLANYANTLLKAFSEVETSLVAENILAEREKKLSLATDEAKNARRMSEDRYNQGIESLITLLEAQRRALDNESQLITVQKERLDARIDLHLALGGGFETNIQPHETKFSLDLLFNNEKDENKNEKEQ